ncbi:chitosanase [Streptomyces sp. CB01373]|uniref:chitosanase n=1 Tax=Streptomyces sp. CB01373 TaxID=2020325 RepID=UPI000C2737B3|nr:chitosanase [Streptomyces sp. CB01373]PJM94620.1 chitosanase [Streptomyces sp. CB01373]
MRRSGILLFAAAPVLVLAVLLAFDPRDPEPSPAKRHSAADESREDTRRRAERLEKLQDDKVVAEAPPGLAAPAKKELAQQLVASAENATLDWRGTYGHIEDVGVGDGYTAGIIGYCTGTHDLLTLVERYTRAHPDNGLAPYLPALREVDGTDSHDGLDPGFTAAWKAESERPAFRKAQERERDRSYFDPAVRLAKLDGLGTLGQFIYYDAMVFHGPGVDEDGFYALRERALKEADTPAAGGREKTYLDIFLGMRREAMEARGTNRDTSRIDTAQRQFLYDGNMDLKTPLVWKVYGETYKVP